MAAASPSHISKEKLTDDFLSCSLCLESYKQPKVLHCQHTFCLPCLEGLMGVSTPGMIISCPLCREETVIQSGDISSLKTNFLIESLLSFVTRPATTEHGTGLEWTGQKVAENCQLCDEKRAAAMYCDDCQVWLCISCSVPHNKLPATKSHHTLRVTDIIGKAKEKLTDVEKELQELLEKIEQKHQAELMEQNFISEQMWLAASQIEASSEKLVHIITEKKCDLLQEIAVSISMAETKQNRKIAQLKEHSQRIKKGLDFVKDMRKSKDAHHITNMMGNVEALRQSVADITVTHESSPRQEIEFWTVESLAQLVRSSPLGNILSAGLSVQHAPKFPSDQETDGKLVHRLAYGYYITGLASTNSGSTFVASNCNSLKKIGQTVCEVDIHLVTKPWGVLKLPSSQLIITDCGKNLGCGSVNIFDRDGKFVRMIAMGLSLPRGIAVDSHGRVYVCDENDRCVYIMTSEGRVVHIIKYSWDGRFLFDAPRFVTVNTDNHIFISDGGKFVKIFDDSFQLKKTYQSPFARSELWDVVTDNANVVFVADWMHGIHVLNSDGDFQGFLKQPVNNIIIKEPTAFCIQDNTQALLVGTSNGEIISIKSM